MTTSVGDGAGLRVVAELADAARQEHAHVALAGAAERLDGRLDPGQQLGVAEGDLQRDHLRGIPQATHVGAEQEGLAAVGAQHLVHAVSEHEPVVEDRDRRVVLSAEPPVDVDHRSHRHRPSGPAARAGVRTAYPPMRRRGKRVSGVLPFGLPHTRATAWPGSRRVRAGRRAAGAGGPRAANWLDTAEEPSMRVLNAEHRCVKRTVARFSRSASPRSC